MTKLKHHIAVVDDEESIHEIFDVYFEDEIDDETIELVHFFDGKEVIDYLGENADSIKIILVLSDINMPVLDGYSLLELIKRDYPKIDVQLISAYDDAEHIKKGEELGASKYYTKPLDFKILKRDLKEKLKIPA